jgi:hypothetical protein
MRGASAETVTTRLIAKPGNRLARLYLDFRFIRFNQPGAHLENKPSA